MVIFARRLSMGMGHSSNTSNLVKPCLLVNPSLLNILLAMESLSPVDHALSYLLLVTHLANHLAKNSSSNPNKFQISSQTRLHYTHH
jgi:hypothetical protein